MNNTISESRLQQQCFMWHWNNYPDQRGRLWMNYNNAKNRQHGAILKGMGMISGVADMTFLRADGRAVFIELKLPGKDQQKKQKDWEQIVTDCNAYYHVVKNETDFQNLIDYHANTGVDAKDN